MYQPKRHDKERGFHKFDSSSEIRSSECFGSRKIKTKCIFVVCQIVVAMWLLAVCLNYAATAIDFKKYDAPLSKARDVFESFNQHRFV